MKDYVNFSISDFVSDPEFVKWVKEPLADRHLDRFWKTWTEANPQKKDDIDQARLIILALTTEDEYQPGPEETEETWRRIESTIDTKRSLRLPVHVLRYAAAIVLLLSAAIVLNMFRGDRSSDAPQPSFIASNPDVTQDYLKRFPLPDGSLVKLGPGSTIEILSAFGDSTREVRLTGEAFFEVAKDPGKPFIVHSGQIVTRVLGTSFVVRNYENENEILVKVKTGRVSVYQLDESKPGKPRDNSALVLTPNQQAVYDGDKSTLSKTLVENPEMLTPATRSEFEFVDASVKDVLMLVENKYGVDILFDEELLDKCHINASLSDLDLHEKVSIICNAINATYEVIDTHIVVFSSGCALDNNQNVN